MSFLCLKFRDHVRANYIKGYFHLSGVIFTSLGKIYPVEGKMNLAPLRTVLVCNFLGGIQQHNVVFVKFLNCFRVEQQSTLKNLKAGD